MVTGIDVIVDLGPSAGARAVSLAVSAAIYLAGLFLPLRQQDGDSAPNDLELRYATPLPDASAHDVQRQDGSGREEQGEKVGVGDEVHA